MKTFSKSQLANWIVLVLMFVVVVVVRVLRWHHVSVPVEAVALAGFCGTALAGACRSYFPQLAGLVTPLLLPAGPADVSAAPSQAGLVKADPPPAPPIHLHLTGSFSPQDMWQAGSTGSAGPTSSSPPSVTSPPFTTAGIWAADAGGSAWTPDAGTGAVSSTGAVGDDLPQGATDAPDDAPTGADILEGAGS